MAEITAALVKELRDQSGAGMMDCKKALAENDGDLAAAVDWLRTKGLAAAQKKSGRVASEGLVAVATDGTKGAVVEVNSETDFVARNEGFQEFVAQVAQVALTSGAEAETLADADFGNGKKVSEQLTDMIATIGENMSLRRGQEISVSKGVVGSYVHGAVAGSMGKIGVLVGLEGDGDTAELDALGKQIAMHIAATSPASVTVDDMDPELVERERQVLIEQARESGRPEEIIEKMVEGRMRKFYEESVLVKQTYVIDGESKVEQVLEKAGARITGFVRMALGEGIEKEESDFAAEVAAAAGTS